MHNGKKHSTVARYRKVRANFSPAEMLWRMLVSCFCINGRTISKSSSKVKLDPSAKKFLNAALSSARSSCTSVLYTLRKGFLAMYGFTQTFLFLHRFLLFLRRKTKNKSKPEAATLRVCHCTTDAMLRVGVCCDLTCERKS